MVLDISKLVDTGCARGSGKTKGNQIAVEDAKACFDECTRLLASGESIVDRTYASIKALIMRLKVQPVGGSVNQQSHPNPNAVQRFFAVV